MVNCVSKHLGNRFIITAIPCYFNGMTNNYVSRYWNWVYIEDMQF